MAAPTEILPIKGLAYSEYKELRPLLCKPKLLPIKANSLLRLEKLERRMEQEARQKREAEAAERTRTQWSTAPTPSETGGAGAAPTGGDSAHAVQEGAQSTVNDAHQG